MGTAQFIFKSIDVFSKFIMNPKHVKGITRLTSTTCDLFYRDDGELNRPIIINIHGGGFMAGDKKYRRYWCELLANEGWFVVNPNYRLCPKVTIVDQIKDLWAVWEQIPVLAATYHLNPNRVVVTGDSAGAFFAAYIVALQYDANLRQRLNLPPVDQCQLAGAMLFCGVYDLPLMLANPKKRKSRFIKEIARSITGLKGKKPADFTQYEYYQELSIPRYVNHNWCPVQVYYAAKDYFVKGQGELMLATLRAHHVPVEEHASPRFRDNHCYHLFFHTKIAKEAFTRVQQFLARLKDQI